MKVLWQLALSVNLIKLPQKKDSKRDVLDGAGPWVSVGNCRNDFTWHGKTQLWAAPVLGRESESYGNGEMEPSKSKQDSALASPALDCSHVNSCTTLLHCDFPTTVKYYLELWASKKKKQTSFSPKLHSMKIFIAAAERSLSLGI